MRSLVLLLLLLLGLLPFRTEAQGTVDSGGCTFTAECSGWLFRDMFSSESIDYTNVDDMVKYYARVEWERARDYARTTMRVDGKCRFGNSVVESRCVRACDVYIFLLPFFSLLPPPYPHLHAHFMVFAAVSGLGLSVL